jgi:3-hydroxyisobutyrate dehydrogenase-like beta-hydroxyacid dehydrogenase
MRSQDRPARHDVRVATVAFAGLGAMGSRMAERLLDAGHELVVWNRTEAKTRPLAERGAAVAASPAEAAGRAEVVLSMVADPAALRAVTEGPAGIAAGVADSATVIEMSTVGPEAVSRLASVLPTGVGLLDAPVLGTLPEAESGTLRIFIGGPGPLVERWMPLLSTLGRPAHLGPLGAGAAGKLVANTTLLGVLGVLGEAVALGRGLGLPDEATFGVLAGTPVAAQAERRRPVLEGGEYPTRFTLALARKDAGLILSAAAAAGVDLRLVAATQTWLADAAAAGRDEQDYSAVLTQIASPGRPPAAGLQG